MVDDELRAWFITEVLPLEPALRSLLGRNSYRGDEIKDLLHDVYERVIVGASRGLPTHTKGYVFAIMRNMLITKAKRAKVVSFDLVADLESLEGLQDEITPERHVSARQELERAIRGMEMLPPRCREVVRMRKLEGLSVREIAERKGVTSSAIERQLTFGMRALADYMLGGSGRIQRPTRWSRRGLVRASHD